MSEHKNLRPISGECYRRIVSAQMSGLLTAAISHTSLMQPCDHLDFTGLAREARRAADALLTEIGECGPVYSR